MKKVIVINGPKNSGKDELAKFLVNYLTHVGRKAEKVELKGALYDQASNAFEIKKSRLLELLGDRETKEVKTPELTFEGEQYSPRGAMIYTSEHILKPVYGSDHLGVKVAQSLADDFTIVPDGGCADDVKPIADEVGQENVLIIRLIRPGYIFGNDNRSYITMGDLENSGISKCWLIPLYNDKGVVDMCQAAVEMLKSFVVSEVYCD
jgi:hypothetical protein